MTTAEAIILMVAGAMAAATMTGRWRPGLRRKHARPASGGQGTRTHYRTATVSEDEDQSADDGDDDDDVPAIDASLAPADRRALRDLWRARTGVYSPSAAAAMIAAGDRAVASTRSNAVRAYAARVMALGLAVSGQARAAVDTLAAVSLDPTGIDDEGIDVLILCRARRYQSAMERAQLLAVRGAGRDAARLMAAIEVQAASWGRAGEQLQGLSPCVDGQDYVLVREAGWLKGQNDQAARIGEGMFALAPDPDLAWAIAGCWVRARDAEQALAWALRAAELGSREWERLDAPPLTELDDGSDGVRRLRAALGAA